VACGSELPWSRKIKNRVRHGSKKDEKQADRASWNSPWEVGFWEGGEVLQRPGAAVDRERARCRKEEKKGRRGGRQKDSYRNKLKVNSSSQTSRQCTLPSRLGEEKDKRINILLLPTRSGSCEWETDRVWKSVNDQPAVSD